MRVGCKQGLVAHIVVESAMRPSSVQHWECMRSMLREQEIIWHLRLLSGSIIHIVLSHWVSLISWGWELHMQSILRRDVLQSIEFWWFITFLIRFFTNFRLFLFLTYLPLYFSLLSIYKFQRLYWRTGVYNIIIIN